MHTEFSFVNSDVKGIRTVPRHSCAQCGSQGKLLYSNLTDQLFGAPGTWNFRLCSNPSCGLSWLDPLPLEADLHLLYQTYYTHDLANYRNSKQRALAALRSFFYGGYLAATYFPSKLLGLRQARQRIANMFLDDLKPGQLLDVGCGNGSFLHQMHKLGWSATGLDFDADAIEYAKARYGSEITVLHTDLASARFPDNSFDAITMNHVIEHVPDPVALLKETKRILKAGGRLTAATPNIGSFGHKKFLDNWRGLEIPRHLQIFSLKALEECARKASFSSVKVESSAANADIIIGASFGLIDAKKKGDSISGIRRVKTNFLRGIRSLLLQYQEALMLRHNPDCGEEAVLICHK